MLVLLLVPYAFVVAGFFAIPAVVAIARLVMARSFWWVVFAPVAIVTSAGAQAFIAHYVASQLHTPTAQFWVFTAAVVVQSGLLTAIAATVGHSKPARLSSGAR